MFKQKVVLYSFFILSFIFMFFLACPKVEAAINIEADIYDSNKNMPVENSLKVDMQKDLLEFEIEYQKGISRVTAWICQGTKDCSKDASISVWESNVAIVNPSNSGTAIYKFSNKASYTTLLKGDSIHTYSEGEYTIHIDLEFCGVRNSQNTVCLATASEDHKGFYESFKLNNKGITSDAQINDTLAKLLYIVNTIAIPVLWGIMGILLIVRGIMLGTDIVKSADEPEVRKKKVRGLVWLFIGIGVGYAITIASSIVMSMFGFGGILA